MSSDVILTCVIIISSPFDIKGEEIGDAKGCVNGNPSPPSEPELVVVSEPKKVVKKQGEVGGEIGMGNGAGVAQVIHDKRGTWNINMGFLNVIYRYNIIFCNNII